MATTYVAIDSQTLTTTASSVTFSSIPATYTDLVLVVNGTVTTGQQNLTLQVNSDTGSNYSRTFFSGDGTTAATNRESSLGYITIDRYSYIQTTQGQWTINFMNYANTSVFKTILVRGDNAASGTHMESALWRSTAAINTIYLYPSASTFTAGSTFTLYGIASAAVGTPLATGGNIITTDGSYWYHAFTSSGTFTPASTLSCDVLAVAGGGSGGWPYAGGGGAGGISYLTAQSVAASAQTVTIGAGGAGAYNSGNGAKGSNSVFGSLTAAVGGGGGSGTNTTDNRAGGSGGGGASFNNGSAQTAGGTPTSGQGFAGGSGTLSGMTYDSGGGGGGAGAVGGNATSTLGGVGGAGTNAYSSWLAVTSLGVNGFIAGGGGGGSAINSNPGAGGAGGGGRGADNDGSYESEAGTANTGGGSGGGAAGNAPSSPKNGGSGLVIVRYAV